MTVKEIVREWLKSNGYSGLCNDECGCEVDDLMPCVCGDVERCEAGYKVKYTKGCDHGGAGESDWRIQSTKEGNNEKDCSYN